MVFYYAVLLHNKFFEGTFGASSHHQSTQVSTLLVCEDTTDFCLYILTVKISSDGNLQIF